MPQFHETGYGKRFFDGQLPQLIKGVEKLGRELARFNDTVNSIDIIDKMIDAKIEALIDLAELAKKDPYQGDG